MHYVITVTEFNEDGDKVNSVAIECHTPYTLVRDISEWVKEDVDSNAQFIDITPENAGDLDA